MTTEKLDQNFFFNLENSLHKKEIRNSREKTAELLADDFIEFGSSGLVYDKTFTSESLSGEEVDLEIKVTDFIAHYLAEDVVHVTYKTSKLDPDTGRVFESLRSSIWKHNGGKWQMVFHQGTKISA